MKRHGSTLPPSEARTQASMGRGRAGAHRRRTGGLPLLAAAAVVVALLPGAVGLRGPRDGPGVRFGARRRALQQPLALDFDMEEAFGNCRVWDPPVFRRCSGRQWERAVGCAAFREKHRDLLRAYAPPAQPQDWPPNPSMQAVSPAPCGSLNRSGVLVFVAERDWLDGPTGEAAQVCPRCGLTCEFTFSRSARSRADAHLYVRRLPLLRELHTEREARARVGRRPRQRGGEEVRGQEMRGREEREVNREEAARGKLARRLRQREGEDAEGMELGEQEEGDLHRGRGARGRLARRLRQTQGVGEEGPERAWQQGEGETGEGRDAEGRESEGLGRESQEEGPGEGQQREAPEASSGPRAPLVGPDGKEPSGPRVPLVVFMNLEHDRVVPNLPACGWGGARNWARMGPGFQRRWGGRACPDLVVRTTPDSDVQLTYTATHLNHLGGHNTFMSHKKLQDVAVHRAASNCRIEEREALASELLRRLPHHSYGQCTNSFGGLRHAELRHFPRCMHLARGGQFSHIQRCVRSHYKFDMAFENTFSTPGYVTEKFFLNLEAGTVPIYYGAPDISNFAPPESYIDARNFTSAESLANFVSALHKDPIKYMQLQAWKYCGVFGRLSHALALGWHDFPCRLCEKIASLRTH